MNPRAALVGLAACAPDGDRRSRALVADPYPGGAVPCAELGASFVGGIALPGAGAWDTRGCEPADDGAFELVTPSLRGAAWADTRCNDGSPYVFGVSLSSADAPWIFYFEGGHQCDDVSIRCDARDPSLSSSVGLTDRERAPLDLGGLLGPDPARNPWAGANRVIARYCSSDAWRGDRAEPVETTAGPTWFTGFRNAAATLDVVRERYGLRDGARVLWAGSSAGAGGAMSTVWYAAEQLPASAAAGDLRLAMDAGWTPHWSDPDHPVLDSGRSWDELYPIRAALWNIRVDPRCIEAGGDEIGCLFPLGATPTLPVPWMVQQSSQDVEYFDTVGIGPLDLEAREAWRALFYAETAEAPWLWSSSLPVHTLFLEDSGWTRGAEGATLRDVLWRFWEDAPPERVVF